MTTALRETNGALPGMDDSAGSDTVMHLYGIGEGEKAVSLGAVGIAGHEVYTIPSSGYSAAVHRCPVSVYRVADEETMKKYVVAHQAVLDTARKDFATIIPMRFPTLVKAGAGKPDSVIVAWLGEHAAQLARIADRIRGRDEYGVTISYAPDKLTDRIAGGSPEIGRLKLEMAGKPAGTAFLYRQRVEKALRAEIERLAGEWFKDFYQRIKAHCDDIAIEKTAKRSDSEINLLSVSCLVPVGEARALGETLGEIQATAGFSVRFTGPWLPYSFVDKPVLGGER